MKLTGSHLAGRAGYRRGKSGMAVIIVMTLLAIILLYVAFNARTLYHLGRDLKLTEQKQTQRLAQSGLKTNTPAASALPGSAPAP